MAGERPNYTVTEEGVQLPEGYKFEAHGHINIKWVDEDGEHSANMHFDPNNNQPGGYYIGKSFFPFSSLIKNFDKCPQVTWVQVHGWNYHYTATPDPDKCATPPAEDDDSSNSDSEKDSDTTGDDDGTDDNSDHDSDSLDDDQVDTSAKSDDDGTGEDSNASKEDEGSEDGTDNPTATEDGSKDNDTGKNGAEDPKGDEDGNPEGGKDGGEIPPTGLSGGILMGVLGLGLVIVGGLVVANSRAKK